MKLVIIGAGAIGGGTAAYLAKNNVDVTHCVQTSKYHGCNQGTWHAYHRQTRRAL
jgi:ketopantoate reductase